MANRRRHGDAHENHERWLVSYADFITLLFAFFVVMFASSQTDKAKAKQISEAVANALENGTSVGSASGGRQNPGRDGGRQGPGQRPDEGSRRSAARRKGSSSGTCGRAQRLL